MIRDIRAFRRRANTLSLHHLGIEEWRDIYEQICNEAHQIGPGAIDHLFDLSYKVVISDRVIPIAARHVKLKSGGTRGPDDTETLVGLDNSALCQRFRGLGRWLESGEHHPGRTRLKFIDKYPTGRRTIEITNFVDRVVAKTIQILLDPLLDPTFAGTSFGFRRDLSRFHALARLESHLADGYETAIVVDIRKAFDSLPHNQLQETLRSRVLNPRLCDLIEMLLGINVGKGIPQGNALSPLMLNLYCDKRIDRPWGERFPQWPMIRYADDIFVLTRSESEAADALRQLTRRVTGAGLKLKDASSNRVFNLRQAPCPNWLGNRLQLDGNELVITYRMDEAERLAFKLRQAKRQGEGMEEVGQRLRHWAHQRGAAFSYEQRGRLMRVVGQALQNADLKAVIRGQELINDWERGYNCWLGVRGRVAPELTNRY